MTNKLQRELQPKEIPALTWCQFTFPTACPVIHIHKRVVFKTCPKLVLLKTSGILSG